jgi:thymidylate kinase
MRRKFIVIEGLDGSGKTSVAETLAKDYSYELVITPGVEFQMGSIIEKKSHYTRLLYYYTGNFSASDYISKASNNIVCNRYIFSTMASFSYFNNISINETYEMMKLLNEKILLPDYVIYLSVPRNILVERLKSRGDKNMSFLDNFILNNDSAALENNYLSLFEKMSNQIKYSVVNSNDLVERTCKNIIEIISGN